MRDHDTMLAAFQGVRSLGNGWSAKCPAHADDRASLKIDIGDDGRWLLHCHAGCTFKAIIAAAHLTPADVFPEKTTPRIVATYQYCDEDGVHLYDAVRKHPKQFFQRPANGHRTMDGVRLVLYHLDQLRGQSLVFIVEGEKDVDALRALGLAATTNVAGALKWREAYTTQLTEAGVGTVVVIPDHDATGRAHADAVATSCRAAGLLVHVVTLPGLTRKGGDVSDWLAAGHTAADLVALVDATPPGPGGRTITMTRAMTIPPRPVHWLWEGRVAVGTVALIGGREGIGKSIVGYTLAADITRGRLAGVYDGRPQAVLVVATEDSWAHTIVPRLMAAGADLSRIYRVEVATGNGDPSSVSLPLDLTHVERVIAEVGAVALLLDPLLSRLDAQLDTHKDGEVRQALEPLVAVMERTGCTALGLIHVNKSTSNDPLTQLMASRAFAAVARAVLFVMTDPDDDAVRLLGMAKNNLGRSDLPTLTFQIVGAKVADTPDGPVWTGKLEWLGESDRSIRDAVQQATDIGGGNRTATMEAADWLQDYLTSQGGSADSADVKKAAAKAGHAVMTLHRARAKLKVTSVPVGYPRSTHWKLSTTRLSSAVEAAVVPTPVVPSPGESDHLGTTCTTDANQGEVVQTPPPVVPVVPGVPDPPRGDTTGPRRHKKTATFPEPAFHFDRDPFGKKPH